MYHHQTIHLETQEIETLRTLRKVLKMSDEQVIIRDFNLHHPSWDGLSYSIQHKLTDTLLDIVRETDMDLTLSQDTITRDCQRDNSHEQTIIDLVFTTSVLRQQLVRYKIETKLDHSSNHLPIHTEFEWNNTDLLIKTTPKKTWKKLNVKKFYKNLNLYTKDLDKYFLTSRKIIN